MPAFDRYGRSAVLAICLAVCAGTPALANSQDLAALQGTQWNLVALDGGPPLDQAGPYIEFGPRGEISGSGGCNGFRGTLLLDGDTAVTSTRMACHGEQGRHEGAFFEALRRTVSFERAPGRLVLFDASGRERAVLAER